MASAELDFRPLQFRSPESPDRKWLEWFRDEYGRRLYNIDIDPNPEAPFRLDVTTRLLPDRYLAKRWLAQAHIASRRR